MDNLRCIITSKILSNIPPHVKPIDYLMETLDISRESVYRRIRGDISFTLEEIAKLSIELEFSIDELIMKDMPSRVFFNLHTATSQPPSDIFVTMYQHYFNNVFDLSYSKDIESTMVLNHIPPEFLISSNHLLKFMYYQWMHQNQEVSLKYFYSDIVLPNSLLSLQSRTLENLKLIKNNIIIVDANVFFNLVKEVHYYYKRRLINDEEFFALKNDLLDLISKMENIAQTGYYGQNARYSIYLSSLNIDSSSRFIKYDDEIMKSVFFVNSIEPIVVMNPDLSIMHKKWLDSMRKYSTLITQSNEILQVKYFNKQRNFIEEISDGLSIVPF